MMDSADVKAFEADGKEKYHEDVRRFEDGEAEAPRKSL